MGFYLGSEMERVKSHQIDYTKSCPCGLHVHNVLGTTSKSQTADLYPLPPQNIAFVVITGPCPLYPDRVATVILRTITALIELVMPVQPTRLVRDRSKSRWLNHTPLGPLRPGFTYECFEWDGRKYMKKTPPLSLLWARVDQESREEGPLRTLGP